MIPLAWNRYKQLVIFAVIGVANTSVHAGIVILLVEIFGVRSTLANGCAFFCANIFSYILNSRYTFHANLSLGSYARFFTASLLALGLTLAISASGEVLGLSYLWTLLVLIFVVPLLSFAILKFWAFRDS